MLGLPHRSAPEKDRNINTPIVVRAHRISLALARLTVVTLRQTEHFEVVEYFWHWFTLLEQSILTALQILSRMVKLTEGMVLAKARASDLENVKKLNCWGGGLTDVSIFQQMPNIEVISLSVNSITTLEDFSFCSNLTELYVRRNCIASLSEIWFLRSLPKLRVLWLADNPCAAGDNYRATVLRILPNLHKLDNIVVTFDEVNRALEEGDELEPPINSTGIYSNGHIPNNNKDNKENRDSSMEFMTLDETNKIREQLGLKPLSSDKLSPAKHKTVSSHKTKNASILSAVLTLIKELDRDSLEVVANACKDRLESL